VPHREKHHEKGIPDSVHVALGEGAVLDHGPGVFPCLLQFPALAAMPGGI